MQTLGYQRWYALIRWKTKMNSIGSEVLEGVNKAIPLAEENFKVIAACRSINVIEN